MAFSKTPDYNTHQTKNFPIQGSPYNSVYNGSTIYNNDTVRYVDCYPEKSPQFGGQEKYYVVKRPTMAVYTPVITTNDIYGFGVLDISTISYVDETTFYASVYNIAKTYTNATFFALPQAYTYNHLFKYTYGTTSYWCCLEHDGTGIGNSHLLLINASTGATTNVDLGFRGKGNAVCIDGYIFIQVSPYSGIDQRIRNCALGDPTTWTSTNYIDAEQFPDRLIYIQYYRNYLVAFGEQSTEFFYDAAIELGSPLQRQIAYSSPITCFSNNSAQFCTVGENLVFIGKETPTNNNGIFVIKDFQIQKYSNPFIERILNNLFISIQGLFSVQYNGNTFCLLYVKDNLSNLYYYYVFDILESWCAQLRFKNLTTSVTGQPNDSYQLWICTNDNSNNTIFVFRKGIMDVFTNTFYKMYTSDTDSNTEVIYSSYTTDLIDFDSQKNKQYNYVDVIGTFGNNTVQLEFTKQDDYQNFMSMNTITPVAKYPNRFRNLGNAFKMAFRVNMTGTSQVRLDSLEVTYNIGQF